MPARPVQISIDRELLREIDAEPEVKKHGRSAFIRTAVKSYLAAKRRRDVDQALRRGLSGKSAEALEEIAPLIEAQAWPED